MPNSTGGSSMHPTVAPVDSGPVQAYAKLEGDSFCYYIRTLQVTLGRKASSSDTIDIPLGSTKSVSRQHARLFYNFSTQRFEMMVLGKNGAFVNEQFVEKGITVPLDNRTKIQIGEVSFTFLLPRMDNDEPQDNMPYGPPMHDHNRGFSQKINTSMMGPMKSDEQTPTPTSEQFDVTGIYGSKDQKPPYSYASLIAQAINSTNSRKMTLNGIYTYITNNYPYYQMASNGWQNSIRHNLSLNKAFIKVPRADSEPGKGAFWSIDPSCESQFSNGVYKRNRRSVTKILGPEMRRSSMDTSGLPYDPAAIANGLRNRAQMESQYAEQLQQRRPPSSSGSMVDSNNMNVVTPTPSDNDMEYNHMAAMSHSSINSVSMQTHQTPPDSRGSADEMEEDRQSIPASTQMISTNEQIHAHMQYPKYPPLAHMHTLSTAASMLTQGAPETTGVNGQSHLERPPAQP